MLTNPLYGDIQIADDWVENTITEDEELVMSRLEAASVGSVRLKGE